MDIKKNNVSLLLGKIRVYLDTQPLERKKGKRFVEAEKALDRVQMLFVGKVGAAELKACSKGDKAVPGSKLRACSKGDKAVPGSKLRACSKGDKAVPGSKLRACSKGDKAVPGSKLRTCSKGDKAVPLTK